MAIASLTIMLLQLAAIPASAQGLDSKLLPSDGAEGDNFGTAVAVSGGTIVVGARYDDDNSSDSGSAYVFSDNGSGWPQVAKLIPSDGAEGGNFGTAVAIDGDTIVVGARWDDDNGSNSGSAYVFSDNGSGWPQVAKLIPNDGAAGDMFGWSVSISGDIIVVGSWQDDDNGSGSGSAYVFSDNGSGWPQVAKLLPDDGVTGDEFGYSVAVSGSTIVVGATADDDSGPSSGSAYVFSDNGSGWPQVAKLIPSDGDLGDTFGNIVAIDGDTIVVGARYDDDNGSSSGSAYVFNDSGSGWTQVAKLIPGDGAEWDNFGTAVAVAGSTIVVGARWDDDNGSDSGSAYVFSDNGSGWPQVAKLLPDGGVTGDEFGYSIAISGSTILVGAPADDDHGLDSGSAYVYQFLPSSNESPVADAGGPYSVDEGEELTLDASGSNDPDGEIALYEWDLDNDGEYDDATGVTTTVVFYDDSFYTVGLKVTDSHDEENTATASITVNDIGPTADLTGDSLLNEEQTGSYNASGSTSSPDAIVTYQWDWEYDRSSFNPSGDTGATQTNAWSDNGTYTVAVRVIDDDGSMDIATLSVAVEELPPEVMLETLSDEVDAIELPEGTQNNLNASLDTAVKVLDDSNQNNDVAAINALEAFINKLEAQRGKKIPSEIVDALIAEALKIIAALSSGT